MRNNNIT